MMKIITLVEDRSLVPDLPAEHGLSLLLEREGESWLFDTGASGIVVDNARRLGADLAKVRGVILSHGHYDHTGGLPAVLAAAGPKTVYAHPDIFRGRFNLKKAGRSRRIGIPRAQTALERKGADFSLGREIRKIAPGVYLSGEIPLAPGSLPSEPFLAIRRKLKLHPDLFVDEQFLLVDTSDGLVMLNGCCHSGLINSLRHVRSIRPEANIRAVIGGFHLRSTPFSELERIVNFLEEYRPEMVAAGHCTGAPAEKLLAARFGPRFQSLRTGRELKL
jgi:7,8-dihydropterin-6-yl-methyl-4-(beta-D-ribofuranosyl)aminobenzene 5'-phosphate synthase